MQLEGIDHVAMGVRDIERSAKWYIDVLGFERLHDGMWNGVPTFIGKGNTGIALFPANQEPKTSAHREIRMLHLAFRADRENFLDAQQELRSAESNSNSRITKSRTRFISAIPMATSSRLRPTRSSSAAHSDSVPVAAEKTQELPRPGFCHSERSRGISS